MVGRDVWSVAGVLWTLRLPFQSSTSLSLVAAERSAGRHDGLSSTHGEMLL